MEGIYEDHESFRDSISTVDEKGKRVWVYPKKPAGKFYNKRLLVSILLLAFLFSGPFIRINGEPLLLLNVLERKFVVFGQVFWPQDLHLAAIGLITLAVFVILFTVVFGRLFCGWVCPQTIFMEMVFRKIEYWIEGDWKAQQKLDKQELNVQKFVKKGSKHLIFYGISFLIANTFLAYIIGTEELWKIITDPPSQHLTGLIAILIFTTAFYIVFSRLREQVCTTICPYGRLQGVLLDRDSVVVAYDYERGEKRGKLRKGEDREAAKLGDCIECHQCEYVCPTGIDIKNGTQLECVNCTACMDACDSIMEKIGKPKGLIRYASENQIAKKQKFSLTTKGKAYSVVLLLLIGVLSSLIITRSEVETTILRTPGVLYQKEDDGRISNLYNITIINKSNQDLKVNLKFEDNFPGEIKMVGLDKNHILVEKNSSTESMMFLILDKKQITKMKTSLQIGVYSDKKLLETVKTNFLGPL